MRFVAVLLAVLMLALPSGSSRAARAPADTSSIENVELELLVFERADCYYCEAFRSTIAARYTGSPTAKRAPLRYVDIDHVEADKLALAGAIGVLPTIVIMRQGREVDRIVGLFGHDNFVKMVQFALQKFE